MTVCCLNLTAGCPSWVRTTRSSEPSCSWRTTFASWGSSREKRTRRTSDRTSSKWRACPAQSGTTDGCAVKKTKKKRMQSLQKRHFREVWKFVSVSWREQRTYYWSLIIWHVTVLKARYSTARFLWFVSLWCFLCSFYSVFFYRIQ